MMSPLTTIPIFCSSKMPITASSCAARTGAMPWSWHAAIKWVPIRPLVLAPQTKNVPASTQNARDFTATPSAATGASADEG